MEMKEEIKIQLMSTFARIMDVDVGLQGLGRSIVAGESQAWTGLTLPSAGLSLHLLGGTQVPDKAGYRCRSPTLQTFGSSLGQARNPTKTSLRSTATRRITLSHSAFPLKQSSIAVTNKRHGRFQEEGEGP